MSVGNIIHRNTQNSYNYQYCCVSCKKAKLGVHFVDSVTNAMYSICNDCRYLLASIVLTTNPHFVDNSQIPIILPNIKQDPKSIITKEENLCPPVKENSCVVPTCKWRYQKVKKNKRYYKAKVVALPASLQKYSNLYSRLTGCNVKYYCFETNTPYTLHSFRTVKTILFTIISNT